MPKVRRYSPQFSQPMELNLEWNHDNPVDIVDVLSAESSSDRLQPGESKVGIYATWRKTFIVACED